MIIDKKRASWRLLARSDAWLNRVFTARYNPIYQSGAIVVSLLVVLIVTGLYLLLYYRLSTPWYSVARVTDQAFTGRWIRGLHRFASDAAVAAAAIHAFRMYAQRRDWGARALAWVSGLVLLFVIFVCGWTGYVMVWDTHAQVLAMEGARFLDALPIFSEPISRAFVGERAIPNAFFFLNLFAHVALPIGLGLLVWIHVSRTARPVLLPPRKLNIAIVLALTVLALAWPIGMAPRAELLRIPQTVPLDFFYGFWLPLTRGVPAALVWAAGSVLACALLFVPLWSRPAAARRPGKSIVNERQCTGCEQCMHDCPWGAISMVERNDGRAGIVARVNPDHCVSCGICIGSCAPMALGPAGLTGRDQLAAVRALGAQTPLSGNEIVVLGCAWSAAARLPARAGVRRFEVGCAGNVHTSSVEQLVRGGAAGVLVVSCPQRDCRGREGVQWLNARLYEGREAELQERVDRRRVRVVEAAAAEGPLLDAALADFQQDIARLALPAEEQEVDISALCDRVEEEVA